MLTVSLKESQSLTSTPRTAGKWLQTDDADATLRQADSQHPQHQAICFEGQSTTHQEYQAPPPVAKQPQPAASTEASTIRFEGESSMEAHYQAPPEEALKAATGSINQQQPDMKVEESKAAFEGHSTMHHDYQAPPLEKPLQFLGQPVEPAPAIPFEGESSMKAHYPDPSTEAVPAASSTALRQADSQHPQHQAICFEGQGEVRRIQKMGRGMGQHLKIIQEGRH